MEHLLNPHVQEIEISGIRKFSNMVAGIEDMVSFTIGQPDFKTPEHVKQAGIRAIEENRTTYTHNAGDLALRKAAAQFVKTKYNLSYKPETEVIVTIGASEAIDITLRTVLTPGSEVILPGPVYPGYEPA
ncbi:aminotransferase class I/II-fold pyridoxal phosphate-dependent enzyme, partial [Heyndrickxia coagulans]|nr:aminotransferase class I/II-fold pyridoxal phosphate-dependent enzyme [Heyndrickxia coagulans]